MHLQGADQPRPAISRAGLAPSACAGAVDARLCGMLKPDTIRQRLLRQRRELLARHDGERARAEEVIAATDPEFVERATEEWEARVLHLLGDADREALGEVTAALTRLAGGEYGRCAICNEPIPEARLEALPVARTCVDCAEEVRRRAHG